MGSYKLGNGPSGCIKRGEFTDQLRDYMFLKNNSSPVS
jgi:hypothetical protein